MTSWHHQLGTGQDEFTLARDTQHTCTMPRLSSLCRMKTTHGMTLCPKARLHVVCMFMMILPAQNDPDGGRAGQGREELACIKL